MVIAVTEQKIRWRDKGSTRNPYATLNVVQEKSVVYLMRPRHDRTSRKLQHNSQNKSLPQSVLH